MSFKPKSDRKPFEQRDFVAVFPEEGNHEARVSLIVDLGIQPRKDFKDKETGEERQQKPCQQVAVCVDLVEQEVDYGGDIGKQQYRLLLNKAFQGELEGINFVEVAPKDANGELIKGKLWTFHPNSMLTRLAKATGHDEILGGSEEDNMDIERLLNEPLMVVVNIKESAGKSPNADGTPKVYKNLNVGALSPVPKKMLPHVAALNTPPKLITFDNATEANMAHVRRSIIEKIKLATNYAGSNMQKAIEAVEAKRGGAPKPAARTEQPSQAAAQEGEEFDDDIPF